MRNLLFLALLIMGCTKSLPVEIHLDKTFSAEDRATILEAVAEWNDRAGPLLRDEKDIFVVGDDAETFHGFPELDDDMHGFYHVDTKLTTPQRKEGDIFGYTTLYDILLFNDYIRQIYDDVEIDENVLERDPNRRERIVRHIIKKVSMHELGHLLGISHYFHREGIMVPGVPKSVTTLEGPHLSEADLEVFCILYDCK